MWKEHEIRYRSQESQVKAWVFQITEEAPEKGCGIQGADAGMGDVDTMRGLNRVKSVLEERSYGGGGRQCNDAPCKGSVGMHNVQISWKRWGRQAGDAGETIGKWGGPLRDAQKMGHEVP